MTLRIFMKGLTWQRRKKLIHKLDFQRLEQYYKNFEHNSFIFLLEHILFIFLCKRVFIVLTLNFSLFLLSGIPNTSPVPISQHPSPFSRCYILFSPACHMFLDHWQGMKGRKYRRLFRAEKSTIAHSQHFGRVWVSVLTDQWPLQREVSLAKVESSTDLSTCLDGYSMVYI